jgi:hypothetical protein
LSRYMYFTDSSQKLSNITSDKSIFYLYNSGTLTCYPSRLGAPTLPVG